MSSPLWFAFPLLMGAILFFMRWVSYLVVCAWVVRRTGDTNRYVTWQRL